MNDHPGFETPAGVFLPEMPLGMPGPTDATKFWMAAYLAVITSGRSNQTARYIADVALTDFNEKVNPK